MAELTTLARPYAKAAFKFALENSQLDQWSSNLGVAAQVLADEQAAEFVSAPQLTADQKAQLIIEVCGDSVTEGTKNFFSVFFSCFFVVLLFIITIIIGTCCALCKSRDFSPRCSALLLISSHSCITWWDPLLFIQLVACRYILLYAEKSHSQNF